MAFPSDDTYIKQLWEQEFAPAAATVTYATSIAQDASSLPRNSVQVITLTGNLLINEPTDPRDGQVITYVLTASGGARTLTKASAIIGPALVDSGGGAGVIASGKTRVVQIMYTGTEWFVTVDREEA